MRCGVWLIALEVVRAAVWAQAPAEAERLVRGMIEWRAGHVMEQMGMGGCGSVARWEGQIEALARLGGGAAPAFERMLTESGREEGSPYRSVEAEILLALARVDGVAALERIAELRRAGRLGSAQLDGAQRAALRVDGYLSGGAATWKRISCHGSDVRRSGLERVLWALLRGERAELRAALVEGASVAGEGLLSKMWGEMARSERGLGYRWQGESGVELVSRRGVGCGVFRIEVADGGLRVSELGAFVEAVARCGVQ